MTMQTAKKDGGSLELDSDGENAVSLVIAETEKRRLEAMQSHDALNYFQLCGEQGVEPEDAVLFERGQLDAKLAEDVDSDLERLAEAEVSVSVHMYWGIRQKDIQSLNYMTLKNIFYGMHNVEMPGEMLNALNPDEILSKWYGAGLMKRHDAHLGMTIPHDFYAVCRAMDEKSYSEGSFRKMSSGCNKHFPSSRGEQKKRLDQTSDAAQKRFVDSFFREYVPSAREAPDNPAAFHDPNHDGRSKKEYVRSIYARVRSLWSRSSPGSS
jgi:hypothetical protein